MFMLRLKRRWKKKRISFMMIFKNNVIRVPKHDIVMILGILNAKIGKEKTCERITGKYTLNGISNQSGEMVCNFAIENSMTVMSTQFQHKTIHKGTWISPDLTTVNQIDRILINTNKKK